MRYYRLYSIDLEKTGQAWGPVFALCDQHQKSFRSSIMSAVVPVSLNRSVQMACGYCVGPRPPAGKEDEDPNILLTRDMIQSIIGGTLKVPDEQPEPAKPAPAPRHRASRPSNDNARLL